MATIAAQWEQHVAAPEAAATWAATCALRRSGFLAGDERIVLFCTGMGLKYPAPASIT